LTTSPLCIIIHQVMNKYGGRTKFIALLTVAAAFNALWAGAATFRVLIDLPARHVIGPVAFADLSRATDLSSGLVMYPVAAIGSALLAVAALIVARGVHAPRPVLVRTAVATAATVAVLAVTVFAAPIMFTIGASADDALRLAPLEDRFTLLTDLRATCTFEGLAPGVYAAVAFHDVNGNHVVDTNFLGMPIEGIGVSRDARGTFGPPSFGDAAFRYEGGRATVGVIVHYL